MEVVTRMGPVFHHIRSKWHLCIIFGSMVRASKALN